MRQTIQIPYFPTFFLHLLVSNELDNENHCIHMAVVTKKDASFEPKMILDKDINYYILSIIQSDIKFLYEHNLMDYSILLGTKKEIFLLSEMPRIAEYCFLFLDYDNIETQPSIHNIPLMSKVPVNFTLALSTIFKNTHGRRNLNGSGNVSSYERPGMRFLMFLLLITVIECKPT